MISGEVIGAVVTGGGIGCVLSAVFMHFIRKVEKQDKTRRAEMLAWIARLDKEDEARKQFVADLHEQSQTFGRLSHPPQKEPWQ